MIGAQSQIGFIPCTHCRGTYCTRLLQLLFFILFTPVTLILGLLRATDWSDWPAYIQQIWAKYFWAFYLEKNFPTMHCQRHLHCNCTGV